MGSSRFVIRFLALNFFFLALPLLIVTTISLQRFYEKTVDQGRGELLQIAELRALTLSEWQPENLPIPTELVYFMKLGQGKPDYESWTKQLQQVVKNDPEYIYAIIGPVSDLEGNYPILASSIPAAVGKNFRNLYEEKKIFEKGRAVVMRYFNTDRAGRANARPYLMAFLLFKDETGAAAGVLVQAVDMVFVIDEVLSTANFSLLDFAILNDQGVVMRASDTYFEGNYFSDLSEKLKYQIHLSRDLGLISLADQKIETIKRDHEGFFEFKWNGLTQIAYTAAIAHMDVSVMVYTPKNYFFKRALKQYMTLYIVYIAILILGVVVVIATGAWISRPFRQLSGVMDEVSRGNLDVKFKSQKFGYEVNILGNIFNTTLEALHNHTKRAEDERVKREMYQRELDLGREVQKNLFSTTFPKEKGVDLAGCYIPSEIVSGDFYLVERHAKGILIAIIDIEGQGIYSSLYALSLRSLLRTYATIIDDVGEMMTTINAAFTAESDVQATALVALYNPETKMLDYTSCGHLPGIVKHARGGITELEAYGMHLGADPQARFETKSLQLYAQDIFFFYTDGLTHAVNAQKIAIDLQGVKRQIREGTFATAEEGVEALNRLWQEHTGAKTPTDEILILACKIVS